MKDKFGFFLILGMTIIVGGVLLLVVSAWWILGGVELENWEAQKQLVEIGRQLSEYKDKHGKLPVNLMEAGINEKICVQPQIIPGVKCFKVKYNQVADKEGFTLAAKFNELPTVFKEPSIGWVRPAWEIWNQYKQFNCCWGIIMKTSYKKDLQRFPEPSDWPDVN